MVARSSLLRRPTPGARPARRASSVVAALPALAPRLVRFARHDYPDRLLAATVKSLGLLGLVVSVLAVTALASPGIARAAVVLWGPFRFARVYDRVFEILLAGGLVLAWRRLDLGSAANIGLRRRAWAWELWAGLRAGLGGLAVALALAWLLGGLETTLRYPPAKTLRKAVLGAGAAVGIGIGEEVLFRGVLLRRVGHDAGKAVAVAVTTLVYAAVHALRTGGARDPVDAWSGVERTVTLIAPLANRAVLPELVGLGLLGLLLAAARLRSGSLWVPIGIHAAWVAVFRIGRLFFAIRTRPAWLVGAGWPPLVGGVAGWVGVGVAALLVFRRNRRR